MDCLFRVCAQQLFVLLLLILQPTQHSLTSALSIPCWLAKTKETFKLSELQYLEAKIQACDYECERLVLDAATGSSLFCLTGASLDSKLLSNDTLPPSLERCDWIGSVLSRGDSADEFLNDIRSDERFVHRGWDTSNAAWTMDYLRLNDIDAPRMKREDYTSKTLLSCVAQAIEVPAALNPNAGTDRLRIVDTGQELYLLRLVDRKPYSPLVDRKKWSRRPFQYSSSINLDVADIVTALMFDLVKQEYGKDASHVSFLDPTCGSGTFLAFALAHGASVQGWDTNAACVEGALNNIEFLFDSPVTDERCIISRHDATLKVPGDKSKLFDCAIANLPWGQNSLLYYNENVRIMESLQSSLRPGAPCAFISKSLELQKDMTRLGYRILGTAQIPPINSVLPSGKKVKGKQHQRNDDSSQNRSTICVVTLALAPK